MRYKRLLPAAVLLAMAALAAPGWAALPLSDDQLDTVTAGDFLYGPLLWDIGYVEVANSNPNYTITIPSNIIVFPNTVMVNPPIH